MTGGPTVFWKVDRSVKKIKFHLKSYFIPDRKTGINSNNLPKLEVRNLCFVTLSVWIDRMMGEWKSKQHEYLLEGTCSRTSDFWKSLDPAILSLIALHWMLSSVLFLFIYCWPHLTFVFKVRSDQTFVDLKMWVPLLPFSFNPFLNNTFYTLPNLKNYSQRFKIWLKWNKVLQTDWKHCGMRRNCSILCFQKTCTADT